LKIPGDRKAQAPTTVAWKKVPRNQDLPLTGSSAYDPSCATTVSDLSSTELAYDPSCGDGILAQKQDLKV
jgi:hypothetical protein